MARAIRARIAHRWPLRLPGQLWRARPVRGPLTAGRFACPAGYSGLSGAAAPGADKPRLRPFSRLTGQGRAAPIPWPQPRGRRSLHQRSARPAVCGAACINAAPAPLFAAQPTKVFCPAFFQKSGGAADKSFSPRPFFKKAGQNRPCRLAGRRRPIWAEGSCR